MATLPEEILNEIVKYVDSDTVKTLRLVNSFFRESAKYRLRRHFKTTLSQLSSVQQFLKCYETEAAENLQVVQFEFSGTHIWTTKKDLKEFCGKYGNFVSRLVLDVGDCPTLPFNNPREIAAKIELIFCRNMKRFLNNCKSLTELTLFLSEYEMERKQLNVGPFPCLKILHVRYKKPSLRNESSKCLLSEIAKQAPQLSSVTIAKASLKRAFKIMSNLATTNPGSNLRLKNLCLSQTDDAELLKVIISEQVPQNIAEMHVIVENRTAEEIQLLNDLSDWVVKSMDVLEGLTLAVKNKLDEFEIFGFSSVFALPKPLLPVLRYLNLKNIMLCPVDNEVLQCPLLQEIRVGKHIKVNSFSGCVFDQVKSASIYVTTQEEFQPWPSILPNVQILQIVGELLPGVFRFPNIIKLKAKLINSSSANENVSRSDNHWNLLTNYARQIRLKDISKCPVNVIPPTTILAYGFRKLSKLKELELWGETQGCWKGILYASRTGQLHRLHKLALHNIDYVGIWKDSDILTTLERYHDVVDFTPRGIPQPIPSDEGPSYDYEVVPSWD